MNSLYSKENFERTHETPDGTAGLANQLSADILARLQLAMEPVLRQVVQELNQSGHRLREYYPPRPGDIAFRDDKTAEGESRSCDLRVGIDLIVSVGFRDTVEP